MKSISIPQTGSDRWEGTTGARCECGGTIEWAEDGYARGVRACRGCLVLYHVRGAGPDRRLVPQAVHDGGIIGDAEEGDMPYTVPAGFFSGIPAE